MSNVPELKRHKSGYQVVETSRELKKKIIKMCVKLPKRYTDLILLDTVKDAKDVARNVRKANSIFPTNQHEAQLRLDGWILASACIQNLSDDLNDILDIPSVLRYNDNSKEKGVTINELNEIADLINEEIPLIKEMLRNDRKRFKNLP